MSTRRLRARVPSAKRIATGTLTLHQLRFHKKSVDGSAKCDAQRSENLSHFILGVLYKIHPDEKADLDKAEGLGSGYEIMDVLIRLDDRSSVRAFTYYATRIDATLKPYDWYREHVLVGARENLFPEDYVKILEAFEFIEDPDPDRRRRELSIYK